jgi:hypothetical protein
MELDWQSRTGVMSNILLVIAVLSVLWGVVSAIMMAEALRRRGIKVSWLFLRVMIFKYAKQYRDVTRKDTGRTGPLFYSYIIAMNAALVTAVAGLILRAS